MMSPPLAIQMSQTSFLSLSLSKIYISKHFDIEVNKAHEVKSFRTQFLISIFL